MKAYILHVSHQMVNGRSLQLVEMGVKGGVKQVGTDLVNFFKISPQVDLCFLEGEKMTSVRDSMVFLDHAKFSAPLSLPTSSAPEKPSVDVEAREFKQFPRLKKGKVTLIIYKIILYFTNLITFRVIICVQVYRVLVSHVDEKQVN